MSIYVTFLPNMLKKQGDSYFQKENSEWFLLSTKGVLK